jgi:hypothetical protein
MDGVWRGVHHWPPLSSVRLCFHMLPSCTLISRPSIRSWPSRGCNFAKFPGRSSTKMPPKSLGTHTKRKKNHQILMFIHWGRGTMTLPVDLPCRFQHVTLVLVQLLNHLLDLFLVLQHSAKHLFRAHLMLLNTGKEVSVLGVWGASSALAQHAPLLCGAPAHA